MVDWNKLKIYWCELGTINGLGEAIYPGQVKPNSDPIIVFAGTIDKVNAASVVPFNQRHCEFYLVFDGNYFYYAKWHLPKNSKIYHAELHKIEISKENFECLRAKLQQILE